MNEKPIDRKTFLRRAPLLLLSSLVPESREGESSAPRPARLPLLRPPGAIPEEDFLNTCCGTGACVEACPAKAIRLQPLRDDPDRLAPIIVPNDAACVVCNELACMAACPSGALRPVPREEIRIGQARINHQACLAWSGRDPGCDYCVDRCPIGFSAISLRNEDGRRGPVVTEKCIGCGVCEFYCPTHPPAIRVFETERS